MGKSANISGGFSIAMFESRRVRRVRLILRRIVDVKSPDLVNVFLVNIPRCVIAGKTVVNPRVKPQV